MFFQSHLNDWWDAGSALVSALDFALDSCIQNIIACVQERCILIIDDLNWL